jgi:hypothetical protein
VHDVQKPMACHMHPPMGLCPEHTAIVFTLNLTEESS